MKNLGLSLLLVVLLALCLWLGTTAMVGSSSTLAAVTYETLTIPLQTGWNLISLPLAPAATAPGDALASIAGHYNLVYAYDAFDTSSPWKVYDTSAPVGSNTLITVSQGMGLWIRATDPVALIVTGTLPLNPSIALATGWNLVGDPRLFTRPISESLSAIAGKYNLVYLYNAFDSASPWKVYDPGAPGSSSLTAMTPGWGYWVRVTEPVTWTVNAALPAPVNVCGAIAGNTVWGEAGSIYNITCNTTVNAGVTVSVTAGTVIKMASPSITLTVNGNLVVNGTGTQKVYITSAKDDSAGGDSNGDGTATTPAAKNWGRINIASGGYAVFDHAVVRYGGNGAGTISNASNASPALVVRSSTISNNGAQGIYNVTGTLSVTNSIVSSNTYTVVTGTVSGGQTDAGGGAGIQVEGGQLILENSTVSDNILNSDTGLIPFGGGGVMSHGKAVITGSIISGNRATNFAGGGGGGGIYNNGTMTITNSTIQGNFGENSFGGGINNGGTMILDNSTIADNWTNTDGGGIENYPNTGFPGVITITGCTINNNIASAEQSVYGGGGIDIYGGAVKVINSTISNNQGGPKGGGLNNQQGKTSLIFTTVSGNTGTTASGIWNKGSKSSTTIFLTNTIIANSSGVGCVDSVTGGGLVKTNALIQDNTCSPNYSGDPLLGPLQNNGGSTDTQALTVGSPALDRIASGVAGCGTVYATDQRSMLRPQNSSCDLGSYELQP